MSAEVPGVSQTLPQQLSDAGPSRSHSARWLSVADWINVASARVDMGTLQWYFGAVCFCWVSKPGHSQQQTVWPGLARVCVCVYARERVCLC